MPFAPEVQWQLWISDTQEMFPWGGDEPAIAHVLARLKDPQNRLPPRFSGCFAPRAAVPLSRARRFFRSSSLSSSSLDDDTCARLIFLGGGRGEDDAGRLNPLGLSGDFGGGN